MTTPNLSRRALFVSIVAAVALAACRNAAPAAPAAGAPAAAPVATTAPATTAAPVIVQDKTKCGNESVVDLALCNGKLHLGMTFRDVIAALGRPSSETNNFQVLTYDHDVLTFDDSQLLVSIASAK